MHCSYAVLTMENCNKGIYHAQVTHAFGSVIISAQLYAIQTFLGFTCCEPSHIVHDKFLHWHISTSLMSHWKREQLQKVALII